MPLEMNTDRARMKRIMEEAAIRHVKAIHYSASASTRVGGDNCDGMGKDTRFWPVILQGFSGKKLVREETDRMERRVREVIGWNEPVKESTSFIKAACQNYEIFLWKTNGPEGLDL